MMCIRTRIFATALLIIATTATAQTTKSLKDSLLPVPKTAGFAMDGFFLWCSSVVKVDDTYHLFASRWPADKGMAGWTGFSECVRATSKNLLGPYKFEEVILQKREGHWDKSRVHNVKIVKTPDGKFVLYYINTANETGYAVADAVTGPWKRCEQVMINASNPAPLILPGGNVYVFCRKRDEGGINRGIAFTADTYEGPYTLLNDGQNLLPNGGELEDPTLWWANNQYNMLLNDWQGHATGTSKAGAQYYSKDGVTWTLVSREPVFSKDVKFDDGTTETFARRERPFCYVNEKGEVEALFTACLPKDGPAKIIAQPVDHYVPNN